MKIDTVKILPLVMIILAIGAGIFYLINKDYRKATYWIAAAILNISVTF